MQPAKLKMLLDEWSFDPEVIERVFYYFSPDGGNVDEADKYLDLMDGDEVTNPADAWEHYCRDHDIMHEVDNNPFVNESDDV